MFEIREADGTIIACNNFKVIYKAWLGFMLLNYDYHRQRVVWDRTMDYYDCFSIHHVDGKLIVNVELVENRDNAYVYINNKVVRVIDPYNYHNYRD